MQYVDSGCYSYRILPILELLTDQMDIDQITKISIYGMNYLISNYK